jgi:hypothetical protein
MHLGDIQFIYSNQPRATQFINLQATGFGFSIKVSPDLFVIKCHTKTFKSRIKINKFLCGS